MIPWTPLLRLGAAPMDAFLDAPLLALSVAGRLLVAGWVLSRDTWLGLAAIYVVLWAAIARTPEAAEMSRWFLLGAAIVTLLRGRVPGWVTPVLVVSGTTMVLYASIQWLGWDIMPWPDEPLPVGTFGNRRYLGAFLALVTPLAPLWLLPVFAAGLALSQSWLAVGAAGVGILVRRPRNIRPYLTPLVLGLAVVAYARGLSLWTLGTRLEAWRAALSQIDSWPSLIFGKGPASWAGLVYQAQYTDQAEHFLLSHSELLQWGYETGLVGLALLAGWLWTNQTMFRNAAMVAAAPLIALFHPFHWAPLAPAFLLVVGAALPKRTA